MFSNNLPGYTKHIQGAVTFVNTQTAPNGLTVCKVGIVVESDGREIDRLIAKGWDRVGEKMSELQAGDLVEVIGPGYIANYEDADGDVQAIRMVSVPNTTSVRRIWRRAFAAA